MLFATWDLRSSGMLRSADLVLTYRRFVTNYRYSLQGSSRIAWPLGVWSGQCGVRLFTFRGNGKAADLLLHGIEHHAVVLIFYFLLSLQSSAFFGPPFLLYFLHSPFFFLSSCLSSCPFLLLCLLYQLLISVVFSMMSCCNFLTTLIYHTTAHFTTCNDTVLHSFQPHDPVNSLTG